MTASTVTGWPVGTIVRGRRVMWQGELSDPVDRAADPLREKSPASLKA